jgi:hypothetical protein
MSKKYNDDPRFAAALANGTTVNEEDDSDSESSSSDESNDSSATSSSDVLEKMIKEFDILNKKAKESGDDEGCMMCGS